MSRILLPVFLCITCTISCIHAVPSSKCAYGYGTTCGTKTGKECKSLIPPALPGDCGRCKRKGCVSCDTVESKCEYCKGGYASIPDDSCPPGEPCFLNECIRCEDPNCGVCSEDPKICEAYPLRCNKTNAPIQPAINAQAKQWEGSVAINRLGYDGTGYTRYYHAWIKNKTCMDCVRGIWTAGTSFFPESLSEEALACDLYQKALKVAANAWVSVPCKTEVKYELLGWLFGPVSNSPFTDKSVTINTESSCTTDKGMVRKIITSEGGYFVNNPVKKEVNLLPSKKWSWAEAPIQTPGVGCTFDGMYDLTPMKCPSFQIVSYESCKRSDVTMTNGVYNSGSFSDGPIPVWSIKGTSKNATLTSPRRCKKSVMTVDQSLVSSKDAKATSTTLGIQPITSDGFCTEVYITRKTDRIEYLTAGKDCAGLKWRSRPRQKSIFKLQRRCSKSKDYDAYICDL